MDVPSVFVKNSDSIVGEIVGLVLGYNYTILRTTKGIYACGSNHLFQLGLGKKEAVYTFKKISFPKDSGTVTTVVAGEAHTLFLTENGLFGCGDNSYGQLGLGREIKSALTPMKINFPAEDIPKITHISTGAAHSLIATSDKLFVCGYNEYGQLGLGHYNNMYKFTLNKHFLYKNIFEIGAGFNHSIISTDEGLLACGSNLKGQLGLGLTLNSAFIKRSTIYDTYFIASSFAACLLIGGGIGILITLITIHSLPLTLIGGPLALAGLFIFLGLVLLKSIGLENKIIARKTDCQSLLKNLMSNVFKKMKMDTVGLNKFSLFLQPNVDKKTLPITLSKTLQKNTDKISIKPEKTCQEEIQFYQSNAYL
ncbi:MAG: hypothetical protein LEGION0398_MBIBDBAK_01452 [Legionellaceae bacterium]